MRNILELQAAMVSARISMGTEFMHEGRLPLSYVPNDYTISSYAMYLGLPVATHG